MHCTGHTWGWSDVWLWGGVDSRFGAGCENRKWCWVAAVWFFATGVGRIIHHHTSYWQVGISWTAVSTERNTIVSIPLQNNIITKLLEHLHNYTVPSLLIHSDLTLVINFLNRYSNINKRHMGHITHLRKQFNPINTYDLFII